VIFKIKKNSHFSGFKLPRLTFSRKLKASITLLGDFSYKCDLVENQKATNKIIGLSDDYFHQINSVRIGFRYLNNKIELMLYYYNNKNHYSIKIGEVICNQEFKIEIEIQDYKYLVKFNDDIFYAPRTSKWNFIRYVLFPYFGGKEKSKSELLFNIKYEV